MRYSSCAPPMVRKPEADRAVISSPSLLICKSNSAPALAQLEALDLSGRGLRQRGHHLDPSRIFPRSDLLLDVLLQLVMLGCLAVAQHDIGFRLEQPFGIGL